VKVGDLVSYGSDRWGKVIGLIIDCAEDRVLVQWNNGNRLWRDPDILEVLSESR